MAFTAPDLPRGLNFEDNRWLAHQHTDTDEIGFCAQCGREDKLATLTMNQIQAGHFACFRCLKQIAEGHTDWTPDDQQIAEQIGIDEKDLPF